MNISQVGIDLIKGFEGFVDHAYNPTGKEAYLTIGYGHYGADVKPGQTITKTAAEELLRKDLKRYVDAVNGAIKVTVNQNQFDALVSLCYNIGGTAFAASTLVDKLNKKDFAGACVEFDAWVRGSGKVLPGLVTRRNKEQALFNTAVPKPVAPKPVVTTVKKVVAPVGGKDLVPYPGHPLAQGAKGKDVTRIQNALGLKADGSFGPATKKAVAAYQKRKGLTADGIVGQKTWSVMF